MAQGSNKQNYLLPYHTRLACYVMLLSDLMRHYAHLTVKF